MSKLLEPSQLDKLPSKTGVYLLKNKNGEIIYIGKSHNIKERVKTHIKKVSSVAETLPFSRRLQEETAKVEYVVTNNEPQALIKESELIKKYKPRYNIMLRDDKQYFYVGFVPQGDRTKNKKLKKLPYLTITHQIASLHRSKRSGLKIGNCPPTGGLKIPPDRVAGPFTDGASLKTVLKYLRKVFPYYTKPHGRLPCQYCHIERCPGPNPDIREYKKNVSKIRAVLCGKRPRVLTSLKKEMKIYSDNLEFEKAERVKRQIMALENIFSHNFKIQMSNVKSMTKIQMSKVKNLGIKKFGLDLAFDIYNLAFTSLEAYDISNIQGKEPVASMVRFDNGKPNKKMYRRFKIRLPEKPDDFAMMREVVRRRLAHPEWPYPDLFLIDGGRGQLNATIKELTAYNLQLTVKIAALAKRFNELYIYGRKNPIPLDSLPEKFKNILMYARDEAHRFAITYHRKLHRKKSIF